MTDARIDWRLRAKFAERMAHRLHRALDYACDYDRERIEAARRYGAEREHVDRCRCERGAVVRLPPSEYESLDTRVAASRRKSGAKE